MQATLRTGDLLRTAGHIVEKREFPIPPSVVLAGLAIWCAGPALDASLLPAGSRLSRSVSRHVALGRLLLRAGLVRESARSQLRVVANRFFEDVDVLVTPALAQLPPLAQRWHERGWLANVRASSRICAVRRAVEPGRLARDRNTRRPAPDRRTADRGSARCATRWRGTASRRGRADGAERSVARPGAPTRR